MIHPSTWRAFGQEAISVLEKRADSLERFQAKLKPGDVLLTTAGSTLPFQVAGKGPVATAVLGAAQKIVDKALAVQLGPFVHAAMYVGDGKIVDAHPSYGVKENPIDILKGQSIKALRPDLPKREIAAAVDKVRSAVGAEYSNVAALKAWARMHFKGVPSRDLREKIRATMCSGLVAEAFSGKLTPWKRRDLVVPPDFNISPHLDTVATVTKAAAAMKDELLQLTEMR